VVLQYLASAPQQCAMPRGPDCQGILGQAQHLCGSPPTLLRRFGPLWLLPLPQAEEHPEGEMISRRCGDTTKYDTAVGGHSQTSLTRHALKSGRITGISAYNLEGRTSKEITSSNL
jgi:hypothetical protein